jgi:cyclomaltodextrinase
MILAGCMVMLICRPAGAGEKTKFTDLPRWAKQAVWYQIFPERFWDGDRQNNPEVRDILGAWPPDTPSVWSCSSWTGDWYSLQSWERTGGKGFYYRAQQRRYGGDLKGIIDKLGYLQDLGINAIYLNPLFESPSAHKYDAAMYHHIDNNFGPDPEGDRRIWSTEDPADPATWRWTSADSLFLCLVREAHARGMHVVLDGVFNHVGRTFWAFEDVRKNGPRSRYCDWFMIKSWDDPATVEDEFDYVGWNGVKDLPQLNRDSVNLASGPRNHLKAIVERWMDPNNDGDPSDGIDGWRLDVADKVPMGFWREFRGWVRHINPDAYLTGEVWWEDWRNDKMYNAEPWLRGDVFDAVMNYRWAREVCRFFKDRENRISASEFDRRLKKFREEYREQVNYGLMNLFDSHDTDRLGSMIVNVDSRYDHAVGPADNPAYNVRKPTAEEVRTQELMVLFQMTATGAPMVYYGDEAGMWGGDDPDDRKPMLWEDLSYADEVSHPFGKPRPTDVNVFNRRLFEIYRMLIALRRTHPALSLGSWKTFVTDDRAQVFAFGRRYGEEKVIVVLNNSPSPQACRIVLGGDFASATWKVVYGQAMPIVGRRLVRLTVPEKQGIVLVADQS